MESQSIQRLPQPEKSVTVLLVSSSHDDHACLREILRHSKWKLHRVANSREALAYLYQHHVPVVISGERIPDGNWKTVLTAANELPDPPKLIVASRLADERLWAEVLNLGGYDLLSIPLIAHEVLRSTALAWDSWTRESEVKSLHPKAAKHAYFVAGSSESSTFYSASGQQAE